MLINYINSKPVKVSTGRMYLCDRSIRKKNVALVKDLVKLKIIGHLNGAIHATMQDPELGVYLLNVESVVWM